MELDYDQNHKHGLDQPPVDGGNLIGTAKHIVLEASDNVRALDPTEYTESAGDYIYKYQHRVLRGGTVRVKFSVKKDTALDEVVKVRKNGADVVTITNVTSVYVERSQDVTVAPGDYIDIALYLVITKDFKICYDRKIYE